MRMNRPVSVCIVLTLAGILWGYCALTFGLLAGEFGVYVAVWLLAPILAILLFVCFASPHRVTLWSDHIRGAVREAPYVLRLVRWGTGAKICVIFAVLAGVLWLRGYWSIDSLTLPTRGTRYLLVYSRVGVLTVGWKLDSQRTGDEGIRFESGEVAPYLEQTRSMQWTFEEAYRGTGRKSVFNPDRPFEWETRSVAFGGRTLGGISLSFPHWLLLALFSVAPVASVVKGYCRYRRGMMHRCPKCDYDLTGNISGICPECGTKV